MTTPARAQIIAATGINAAIEVEPEKLRDGFDRLHLTPIKELVPIDRWSWNILLHLRAISPKEVALILWIKMI